MKILDILRGIGGEFEIARVSLAIGGFFAVVTPIAFEVYEIGWNGGHFDVASWCLAYPGGLVALVTGGVFAIGNKDKAVATAKTVEATNSLPAVPPAPPPTDL